MLSFTLDLEPLGRRIPCRPGKTVLEAARRAGIALNAPCGGEGLCGRCEVRRMDGDLSALTDAEEETFTPAQLAAGWRLACQCRPLGDARLYLPPASLATAQRIQTEGRDFGIALDPAVRAVEADDRTLFLRGGQVMAVRPPGATPLGLAVDLGTTKLAGYLLDLSSGETLAAAGAMNPQIAFGEDVMSRLAFAMHTPGGADQLRTAAVEAVNALVRDLCARANRPLDDVADAVMVGNTAMHHLFLGLPVAQLGAAPYTPAATDALDLPARDLGLAFLPDVNVHWLPNIAGFVGADHVAMLIGSGMLAREGVVLGLDIGTNTEISLLAHGAHYACSAASGPAFEGAHIRHGMRAAPGAIEKVLIYGKSVRIQTIEDQPPLGLCGSGILDLVAQLRLNGWISPRGAFLNPEANPCLRRGADGWEVLVTAGQPDITFSRRDINEVQLAKGAIRAAVQTLLDKAGVPERAIDAVVIAGAFGTYLDVHSGMAVGLFPRVGSERFSQVGNAAGTGARMALLSQAVRRQAVEIARRVRYVELTAEPGFTTRFARALMLD
ncbi:MAG: ASKHA domain-containing protein [Anaerolineales bacterium]